MVNITGVLRCHRIYIQNMLYNIFASTIQQCLCSPKLSFRIQLQLLHDFLPILSGIFEDEISFQKCNLSWNEFNIRFVQDILTWCARNPPLSETDFWVWAPMAPRFPSWFVRFVWRWDQLSEVQSELKWIQYQVCPGYSYLMHSKPSAHETYFIL